MIRLIPLVVVCSLAGCVTSLASVPEAEKQYPYRVAVSCENRRLSKAIVNTLEKSGLVLEAHNPAAPDETGSGNASEVALQVVEIGIEKRWKRNTWCYVTTIPGFPVAFVFTSFILAPIFGPYGGYVWFPPNVTPIVTVSITVSAELKLGAVASTKIEKSASRMCKLRRSWMQLGRIDDGWFSTVLGGRWDQDYKTKKGEWSAFFRPSEVDWVEVENIAFHNIACSAVTWLEGVFRKVETGW